VLWHLTTPLARPQASDSWRPAVGVSGTVGRPATTLGEWPQQTSIGAERVREGKTSSAPHPDPPPHELADVNQLVPKDLSRQVHGGRERTIKNIRIAEEQRDRISRLRLKCLQTCGHAAGHDSSRQSRVLQAAKNASVGRHSSACLRKTPDESFPCHPAS
jgi:hypothetical protein